MALKMSVSERVLDLIDEHTDEWTSPMVGKMSAAFRERPGVVNGGAQQYEIHADLELAFQLAKTLDRIAARVDGPNRSALQRAARRIDRSCIRKASTS